MLDVAAVAGSLLVSRLAPALRDRFLRLWPDRDSSMRALLLIIALHDLGKATPAFQGKVEWAVRLLPKEGFDFKADKGARHHSDIGHHYLQRVLAALGLSDPADHELSRAVTAHHGQFPTDSETASQGTPGAREEGNAKWDLARKNLVESLTTFFGVPVLANPTFKHADVMLLAGLTSLADWIGSLDEVFVYEPPQGSLRSYWGRALERAERALDIAGFRRVHARAPSSFVELFPGLTAWPLHEASDALASELAAPSLFIVEAPMGEGKTEAAFVLAENAAARLGQGGLFIGLPTQATANQMLGRVQRYLQRTARTDSTLVLAHGEASLVVGFQKLRLRAVYDGEEVKPRAAVAAEEWFLSKKRTLLAQHAVGTLDQALLSVMLVPHNFVRLFGLAGKTVILDEIHAYDTYTGTLLDTLLAWLAAAGTTVILLSATLPAKRRRSLAAAYARGAGFEGADTVAHVPYPRITTVTASCSNARPVDPRGASRQVHLRQLDADIAAVAALAVAKARDGACVGFICNTVARAQEATRLVREVDPDVERLLLHSRLFPEARQRRECQLERWLGPETVTKDRPAGCIVIGTQVLEQSLDVDVDVLVTDLAPIDLVLQRAGRL
jgi:CRISPR-associated endonuclease/helicase Cas3